MASAAVCIIIGGAAYRVGAPPKKRPEFDRGNGIASAFWFFKRFAVIKEA